MTDIEIVKHIQSQRAEDRDDFKNDNEVRRFCISCFDYFKKNAGVFLGDMIHSEHAEDLFQESFLTIWNEIYTSKINIVNGKLWRRDKKNVNRPMTANLRTFLLSIAKNNNLASMRDSGIYDPRSIENIDDTVSSPQEEEVTLQSIVMQCVDLLPKRCKEILTLFYYDGLSLDEILLIRKENQSKNGLKTGKNKCMNTLKSSIIEQCQFYNLNPFGHA